MRMRSAPSWGPGARGRGPGKVALRAALLLCGTFAACILASGCKVGPRYTPPPVVAPPAYKEKPPAGWKEALPADGEIKGKWWEIYQDPLLSALVEQVNISNQNVLAAEAQYVEAKASVRVARAALFPQITGSTSVQASFSGGGGAGVGVSQGAGGVISTTGGSTVQTTYTLPISATYAVDLFGAIRRNVSAAVKTA